LLCFSMLIGSTFAWFTDSVTSGKNKIVAGNLDVELDYIKVVDGVATDWATVKDQTSIFDPNALWEPGHVEVVYLRVSNLGTLELKYQLGVNVYDEVVGKNEKGEDVRLSDHLVFTAIEITENDVASFSREEAKAAAGTVKGLKDYNGKTTRLEVGEKDYVALIVYMPETVGNEANYRGNVVPSIELGINLFATQYTAEDDSFGDDYDEDAWHPQMKVYNAADLQAALTNGGNYKLMENIDLDAAVTVPAGVTVTLDLGGKTITGTKGRDADNNRIHVLVNNGTLNLVGGTVKSAGADGGSAIYNEDGATLTIKDVTVYGAPLSNPVYPVSAYPSYGINNYGMMTVDGVTVKSYHGAIATGGNGVTVINDADIDVGLGTSTGITSYAIYSFEDGKVTVNGGKFAFTKQEVYVNGGNTFCELGTNPIMINGGTYISTSFSTGADREYVIKGGTFDADPSAYVASGFKAIDNNGVYYVVPENINTVVVTADQLADAISNGGVIAVMADIDMANSWTSVRPTKELTILGNGNTITNLNLPLLAGNVSTKLTIDGLTIADSVVAPAANENGLGSAAFVPYVDAAGYVTLTDCHIKNSTISATERAGGLVGYTSGSSLTIKDCSVEGCTITGVGGAAGLVAYSQSVTTIENSSVKNSNVTATEDRLGTKAPLAGAVIGTINANTALTNVTVSGNTVSNNNATAVLNQYAGRWVAGELTIDGAVVAATADDLADAFANGETNVNVAQDMTITGSTLSGAADDLTVTLGADTTVTVTSGAAASKDITITGDKSSTVVLVNTNPGYEGKLSYQDGANLTFKGITFDANEISGICARGGVVTFIDCFITGELEQTIASKFVFSGCTFDVGVTQVGYGCPDVVFEGCTFETDGYGIKIYKEANENVVNLTVKDCSFKNTGSDARSAILLDHILDGFSYNITVENCTFEGYTATPTATYNMWAERMIVADSFVKTADGQYIFSYQTGAEGGAYHKILTADKLVVTVQ